jgi:hypothetical protein
MRGPKTTEMRRRQHDSGCLDVKRVSRIVGPGSAINLRYRSAEMEACAYAGVRHESGHTLGNGFPIAA